MTLSSDDLTISEFNEVEFLQDDEIAFHYLSFAIESGYTEEIILALNTIARAKAKKTREVIK